jgi:hypothetical protein
MLSKFLKSRRRPIFELPDPGYMERRDIEKSYARLFTTDDGRRVLAHLQSLTLARAYGADAPDSQIRYAEGQRALVTTILRFIGAGKTS